MPLNMYSASKAIWGDKDCQEFETNPACSCCGGSGEHQDRPGNDPDALMYACQTCDGIGVLKVSIEEAS